MHDYLSVDDIKMGFKAAMRRFTSTISIISTEHQGVRYGMAATAVQSLSADPPSVLICVNKNASIHVPLHARGRFAVNMLHVAHMPLVELFSGKLKGEERFSHGDWEYIEGIPTLKGAQACLICDVAGGFSFSSHDVVIGQVRDIEVLSEIAPLLYEDGKFVRSHHVEQRCA